jgi:hypothetical protein
MRDGKALRLTLDHKVANFSYFVVVVVMVMVMVMVVVIAMVKIV